MNELSHLFWWVLYCYAILSPYQKNRKTVPSCGAAAVISVSHTEKLGSDELMAVTGPSGTTQRMTGLVIHPPRAWCQMSEESGERKQVVFAHLVVVF